MARPTEHDIVGFVPQSLAIGIGGSKTLVVTEPVVPSEYVARVREVTAELRELIPRVAWIAGRARALLDADVFDSIVDDREIAEQMTAAGMTDLADVAELLVALLNLSEPLAGDVLVDLMWYLDHHERT